MSLAPVLNNVALADAHDLRRPARRDVACRLRRGGAAGIPALSAELRPGRRRARHGRQQHRRAPVRARRAHRLDRGWGCRPRAWPASACSRSPRPTSGWACSATIRQILADGRAVYLAIVGLAYPFVAVNTLDVGLPVDAPAAVATGRHDAAACWSSCWAAGSPSRSSRRASSGLAVVTALGLATRGVVLAVAFRFYATSEVNAMTSASHAATSHCPSTTANGGFDHAAVHAASGHVYVAHTANDAVDVFDPGSRQASLFDPRPARRRRRPGERRGRARLHVEPGGNTIGVFAPGPDPVGAHDRRRRSGPMASPTTRAGRSCWRPMSAIRRCRARTRCRWSILTHGRMTQRDRGAGRTRWTVFDPEARTLLRQHHAARRRSSWSIRASPTGSPAAFPCPMPAPHGLDFDRRYAPPVLRLRCGRAGHPRRAIGQGAGREA